MIYNILQYVFAGLGALSIGLGAWQRQKRGVFFMSALASFASAIAAHYHVFWATSTFGMCIPWALLCALNTIDMSWRLKTGFVLFLALGSVIAIYPTYHDERWGRVDRSALAPEERAKQEEAARVGDLGIREWLLHNVNFRLVRGLDLKGGLRLVYTVDVDEAIRDKRDRFYDELRQSLARAYGFTAQDKQSTNEDLKKLIGKVRLEKSRDQAGTLFINFEDAADADKINDEFMKTYGAELARQFSSDRKRVTMLGGDRHPALCIKIDCGRALKHGITF